MKNRLPLTLLMILNTINFYAQGFNPISNNSLTYTINTTSYTSIGAKNTINSEAFSSEILKKRLQELNNKTPFNVVYNATVERFIRLYLKTRKSDISNLMDKAKYYFPMFEEHLDKFDLPLEIKYLAIVESALEPNARSVAGAKGLWQIMYHTGKQYDLNVTSYIDERSDPIKSTQAACKYLQDLYKRFDDWDLALAAYNSGPGNVSKAIKRSGGMRNYWNIRKYLPTETSSYVPAFYATYYLFEYGNKHHITPKNTGITFYDVDTIQITKKITFKEIQQITAIDQNVLKHLNPQYRLGIIPIEKGKNHVLTLPKSYLEKFITNNSGISIQANTSKIEKPAYIIPNKQNSYIVQNGDNLSRIAKKFNISIAQLKKWNGLETNYLIERQRLVITKNNLKKANITLSKEHKEYKEQSKKYRTYIVKEGDSLWKISKIFPNTTISQIRNWNNIWGVNHVKPGTKLKILTEN